MTSLKLKIAAVLCMAFNMAALTVPAGAAPKAPGSAAAVKTLSFYNVHTGETLVLKRHKGDPLTPKANWFLRDYRRGETTQMDPHLMDLLVDLQTAIRQRHPGLNVEFDVVSSFRAPETNEALRRAGGSQAEYSQHMKGRAIDIRVPGLPTAELRDIASCLGRGGVGYYAEDGFVHVDTGRVRYWPSHDYLASLSCTVPQPGTAVASRTTKHHHPKS